MGFTMKQVRIIMLTAGIALLRLGVIQLVVECQTGPNNKGRRQRPHSSSSNGLIVWKQHLDHKMYLII